jgi:hypothetical protein
MIKSYVGNSSSHCIQTVHAGHSRIQAGSLCGVSLEKEKDRGYPLADREIE